MKLKNDYYLNNLFIKIVCCDKINFYHRCMYVTIRCCEHIAKYPAGILSLKLIFKRESSFAKL